MKKKVRKPREKSRMQPKLITVKQLKEWLSNVDDDLVIELMIETGNAQYQYYMTDMAVVKNNNGVPQSVVFIREPMTFTKGDEK